MKTMVLRLATFFAVALFTVAVTAQDDVFNADFNLGGAGGGAGCATCYMNQSGYTISLYCGSPDSGSGGKQYCRIETYPEGSYCLLDGDDCCVD